MNALSHESLSDDSFYLCLNCTIRAQSSRVLPLFRRVIICYCFNVTLQSFVELLESFFSSLISSRFRCANALSILLLVLQKREKQLLSIDSDYSRFLKTNLARTASNVGHKWPKKEKTFNWITSTIVNNKHNWQNRVQKMVLIK